MRTDGTSAHQRTDTLVAPKFVSFFLFLSLPGYGVYTHSTSPLTVRRLLPPCCQRSPAETKEAEKRGLRFLNKRKLVLITLPLKKHSDPVNPHAGCQLQTMQQSTWRINLTQPHPECPLPAQDKHLPSLPFICLLFPSLSRLLFPLSPLFIPFVRLSCCRCFFTPRSSIYLLPLLFLLISHPPPVLFLFLLEAVLSSPPSSPLHRDTTAGSRWRREHSTFFTPLPLYP